MIRLKYDPDANAAYLSLKEIGSGEVAASHACDHYVEGAAIVLEFDVKGRLLGIEILGADKLLAVETLEAAERPA
jgi:uncharacterized protein YuzE